MFRPVTKLVPRPNVLCQVAYYTIDEIVTLAQPLPKDAKFVELHKLKDFPMRSDGGTKGHFTMTDWENWKVQYEANCRLVRRYVFPDVPPSAPTTPSTTNLVETVVVTSDIIALNGIPDVQKMTRLARIYETTKNAMQSGTHNASQWQLEFDNQERWENPLMGWISSGDPLSNLVIKFTNAEQAIRYCERQGWDWYVQPSSLKPRKFKPKSYGDNFSWNKRTRVTTK